MAAGIIGANITINSASGSKSVNTILGGTNTYEKVIVNVIKVGPNPGAINVGGINVSASIFGMIIETGKGMEFYQGHIVASGVNIGANLFFFNPSSENVRLDVLGFATA